jgi:hypothetical protein
MARYARLDQSLLAMTLVGHEREKAKTEADIKPEDPRANANRMSRILMATLFVLTALSLAWASDDQPVVEWIRAHALRLQTPEAGHGFVDMQPLKKVIGNARIVSLGEATHGTREFFQLKHRMLEFLATEMGFTIFSIEANMPEAYRLNDFVQTGNGDPAKLIRGMYFWTWDTQEVLDMVRWMREFNKSGKGRVEFTGFDMQTPDVAMTIVSDFVANTDPDYSTSLRQAIDQAKAASPTPAGPDFGLATASFPVRDAVVSKNWILMRSQDLMPCFGSTSEELFNNVTRLKTRGEGRIQRNARFLQKVLRFQCDPFFGHYGIGTPLYLWLGSRR